MDGLTIILLVVGVLIVLLIGYYIGLKAGKFRAWVEYKEKVKVEREDAVKRSRSVLSGQFSEQLAPYLPNFNHSPSEVRFIGKPIDFVVFKGMDDREVEEVVFVEVKTGKSSLSPMEKSLKKAIENKRVTWEEYRFKG